MKWSSAVSEKHLLLDAISECGQDVRAGLDGERPDLAIVFVSAHYAPQFDQLSDAIFEQLGECTLIGCSGSGVIGAGKEVEHRPGFALTAARLPDVDLSLFHITTESLPDGDAPPERWQELVNVSPEPDPNFVLLADPFSIRGDELLMGLDYAFPRSVKIGGIASGGSRPGETGLFLQDRVYDSGVVGLALSGNIVVDTVVAQGCRPVGSLLTVTGCSGYYLTGLDDRPAVEVLVELYHSLLLEHGVTDYDRDRCWLDFRRGLLASVAVNVIAGAAINLSLFAEREAETGVSVGEVLFGWLDAALTDHDVLELLPPV